LTALRSENRSAMHLLAVRCALAILVDDQLAPDAREVLVGPFRAMLGSPP
jgi:hypothetical protein